MADRRSFRGGLEVPWVDSASAISQELAGPFPAAAGGAPRRRDRPARRSCRGRPLAGEPPSEAPLRGAGARRTARETPPRARRGRRSARPAFAGHLAILATTLQLATPIAAVRELVLPRTDVWTASAKARASAKFDRLLAEVEVSLVEPGALDRRDDSPDRAPDRLRILLVDAVPRVHEDSVRTPAERLGARHRRMDPELARLVVRGRHDSSAVRVAADDQGRRAELGVLELLDAGPAKNASRSRCPTIMLL